MRELVFLHYRPGRSFWHRHDPRLKLAETAAWSVLALTGGAAALAVTAGVLIILHATAGSRLRRLTRPLLFWSAMAAALILTGGLSDAGRPLVFAGRTLPLGIAGLKAGALKAARLLTVLLAGQLLASTTDPADLSGAIRRLTAFLPVSWSASLAAAISLTLSFIPRILDEAALIRDAAFSRGLGHRRSVFRRAVALGLPLADSTLRRADLTTEALLSRGFVADPTPAEMRLRLSDFAAATLTVLPPLLTILFV